MCPEGGKLKRVQHAVCILLMMMNGVYFAVPFPLCIFLICRIKYHYLKVPNHPQPPVNIWLPLCRTWLRTPPRPITATVHHGTEDIALKEASEFDWSRKRKVASNDSSSIYSHRLIIPDKCPFNKAAPVGLNTWMHCGRSGKRAALKGKSLHLPISNSSVCIIWKVSSLMLSQFSLI